MSTDYKMDIQVIAEELAEAEFSKDFYELSPDQQYDVYSRATDEWMDRRASAADLANDTARENSWQPKK